MNQYNNRSAIIVSKFVSIIQIALGIVNFLFFSMMVGLIVNPPSYDNIEYTYLITCILFTLGLILTIKGFKRRALIKRFKNYVKFLSGDPLHSLQNLALSVNSSIDKVRDDINLMIASGYFKNAYINGYTNCLVFGKKVSDSTNNTGQNSAASQSTRQTYESPSNNRQSYTSPNMTGEYSTASDTTRKSTIASDVKISINQVNFFGNMMPNEPEKRYKTGKCKGCGAPFKILEGTVDECEYCGSYIQ